jgi:hypothetical protein
MIVVTSRASGTRVELHCCLCRQRLGLTQAWMAFPADADGAESKWVHEACVQGCLRRLFDQSHAVLMRADMALAHLALALNCTTDE